MSKLEFDEAWLADYERRTGKKAHDQSSRRKAEKPEKEKKPNKYRAQPTMLGGRRYDSRHEAERAAQIRLLWQGHEIAAFAEQVEFLLPGGIRYRADFVLLHRDGSFTIEDAKGVQTPEFKLKRRLMAEQGFEIKII